MKGGSWKPSSSKNAETPQASRGAARGATIGAKTPRGMADVPASASRGGEMRFSFGQVPASAARRSSTFRVSAVGGAFKDSRPITERDYQSAMQKSVHDFLVHEVGVDMAFERIRSPSKNDFQRIFDAIYSLVDGAHTTCNKMEEDVPRIFKELGYPIAIKASTMQTIGAQHTWPHLLAALCWLIEVVKIQIAVQPSECLLIAEETIEERLILLEYFMNCFKRYSRDREKGSLPDYDFFHVENRQLLSTMSEEDYNTRIAELHKQKRFLMQETNELKKYSDDCDKLDGDIADLKADLVQLEIYKGKTIACKESMSNVLAKQREERERLEKELVLLRAAVKEKQRRVAMQEMSQEQARSLFIELEELKSARALAKEQLEMTNKTRYEKERVVSRLCSEIAKKHANFVADAEALLSKFFPDETPWRYILEKTPTDPDYGRFINEQIKPQLLHFHDFLLQLRNRKKAAVDDARARVQQMQDDLDKHAEAMANVDRDMLVFHVQHGKEKERWTEEVEHAKMQLDVLRHELDSVGMSRSSISELNRQIAESDKALTDLKVKKMMEQRGFVDDVAAIMQHLQSGNDNVKINYGRLDECKRELREAMCGVVGQFELRLGFSLNDVEAGNGHETC